MYQPRLTPSQLFAELKRRRVLRVLVPYVVAALAIRPTFTCAALQMV